MSSSTTADKSNKLSVVIGTYHCAAAQFDFDLEAGTCKRQWVDNSSTKSISTIKLNGFFCIFGSNDELVRIINVMSNKNVGSLHEHQSSITHVETFKNTHLFSSSDDGKICIWEIGKHKSWECLCYMSHENNNKILSFSIHPSGRLMLSIDNKNNMKIWDLMRAKCIITIKMPKPAICVKWSPNGYNYAIIRENKVLIYKNDGSLYKIIKAMNKIISFSFITYDMFCIADTNSKIMVYDIDTKILLFTLVYDNDDKSKIKSLKICNLDNNLYLISADNKGKICIWNIHQCLNQIIQLQEKEEQINTDFEPLIQVDTNTHITCMDVGIIGRLNEIYKWKKPNNKYNNKRNFNQMMIDDEINEEINDQIIDSDDDDKKNIKRKKKRKKRKKNKPKIDLSRFD